MIILSHTTALHFLRHFGADAVAEMPRCGFASIADSYDSATQAIARYRSFAENVGSDLVPLHILKAQGRNTDKCKWIKQHTIVDIEEELFVAFGGGVYCASPELTARQLASWGTLNDLVYLLYELCGVYSHPGNADVDVTKKKAFTSKAKLEASMDSWPPFPLRKKMETAVGLVRDRSASPMETACAMILGMPCRYGGLGFPDFEMNREIVVPRSLRKHVGRSRIVVDLCWFERRVAWEYDSAEWHCGAVQVARDAGRRNALLRLGFKVVTLAGVQASQSAEVARAAAALSEALEHRCRPRCRDYQRKRRMLEWLVLKDKASVFDANPRSGPLGRHPEPLDSSWTEVPFSRRGTCV